MALNTPCMPPPADSDSSEYLDTGVPRTNPRRSTLEETGIDTVRPPPRSSGQMHFRILDVTTYEEILVVTADNYVHAAAIAAKRIFRKDAAQRETGSAGGPGMFICYSPGDESTIGFRVEEVK